MIWRSLRQGTLYESTDPSLIVAAANARGMTTGSPYPYDPAVAPDLYYQLTDGAGLPALIRLTKRPAGLLFHY